MRLVLCCINAKFCERQILQENIRWKALEEIYNIYMLLHRSDLNISEKNSQTFSNFGRFLQNLLIFEKNSLNPAEFDEILSEFRKYIRK